MRHCSATKILFLNSRKKGALWFLPSQLKEYNRDRQILFDFYSKTIRYQQD